MFSSVSELTLPWASPVLYLAVGCLTGRAGGGKRRSIGRFCCFKWRTSEGRGCEIREDDRQEDRGPRRECYRHGSDNFQDAGDAVQGEFAWGQRAFGFFFRRKFTRLRVSSTKGPILGYRGGSKVLTICTLLYGFIGRAGPKWRGKKRRRWRQAEKILCDR